MCLPDRSCGGLFGLVLLVNCVPDLSGPVGTQGISGRAGISC